MLVSFERERGETMSYVCEREGEKTIMRMGETNCGKVTK